MNNEISWFWLAIGLLLAAAVAYECITTYLSLRAKQREQEWREKYPNLAKDRDFFGGSQWTPQRIAKMNADMANMNPLVFNRTNIKLPPQPDDDSSSEH